MRVYWQEFSPVTHIFYIICVWKRHQQLIVMQKKYSMFVNTDPFFFLCCQLLCITSCLWPCSYFYGTHFRRIVGLTWRFRMRKPFFPEIGRMSPDCFQSLVFAMFPCVEHLPSGGACASVSACLLIRMRICVLHMRIVRSAFPLHTTEIFHHMKANRGWYACRASRFHLPCPLKLVGPCIQQHLVPIWSQAEGWVPHCAAENTAYCTFK